MSWFGTPGEGLDMYHVGLVVPDLAEAMAHYTDALGFVWATVRPPSVMKIRVDGEPRHAEIVVTYSLQGPPYLELVEERSGNVWGADSLSLNHVGFWADDVAAGVERLTRAGLAARVHDDGPQGRASRFSYHQMAGGMWMELVGPSFRGQLESWLASSSDRR